jgi:hypothetical protein
MCVVSAGIVELVSVAVLSVLVVSVPFVLDEPPPQAAKAPSANTNKSFFMFLVIFMSEFWY